MYIIADLQLHSKYARAVSKNMTLPAIDLWARKKGIHVAATGDWTHPLWMKDIQEQLEEHGNGLLTLRSEYRKEPEKHNAIHPYFLLVGEVSCIFSQGGKGRRIHLLLWVPTIQSALKINKEMTKQGCNLMSDGRPIIGLSCMQVAELVLAIEPAALIIPAHAWTPWFGLYGSMSGFDSIDEAFGSYANRIYAVETGLSSTPAMNWQIKELDNRAIVSFSDAHSGPKMGREATVFSYGGKINEFSYQDIYNSLVYQSNTTTNKTKRKNYIHKTHIAYTIEFFPEEGKYHYSGHRACGIRFTPQEIQSKGTTCPVCGKPLTEGVVQRVSHLSKRTETDIQLAEYEDALEDSEAQIIFVKSNHLSRPSYVLMVPLMEIIAECISSPVTSKKVMRLYEHMIEQLQTEFYILLYASIDEITKTAGNRIAQAIHKIRKQDISIDPGYDGVFGVVKIWKDFETIPLIDASKEQLTLFN